MDWLSSGDALTLFTVWAPWAFDEGLYEGDGGLVDLKNQFDSVFFCGTGALDAIYADAAAVEAVTPEELEQPPF